MSGQPDLPAFTLDLEEPTALPDAARGGVVAIGSFDGVHLGHQRLIATARHRADCLETTALALTFEPHPRAFFSPQHPLFRLSPPETRRKLMAISGAAGVVEATFNHDLADLDPDAFARSVLVERLGVAGIVVGEGFRYGRGRAGTTERLRAAGQAHGFDVEVVAPVLDPGGQVISSGRVREALAAGDVNAAAALLGYRWFISGTVVHGDKRGRELGYPTANVMLPASNRLHYGVYAASVRLPEGSWSEAVISFGTRPTFDGAQPLLEAHLFDYSGDIYGDEITVVFQGWIRPESRFDSVDALLAAMAEDSSIARQILRDAGPGSKVDRALTESF